MNKKILLKSRPNGVPTLQNFKLIEADLPKIEDGEIIVKVIYFSLDPYMRGRMNDAKSYAKPVALGEVMEAGGVGEVIESRSPSYKPGDIVVGPLVGRSTLLWVTNLFEKLIQVLPPYQLQWVF